MMYLCPLSCLLLLQLAVATPYIHWRGPHAGGVAGGTVLTLSGGGFATDAYSTSNVVWLEGDDGINIICDVISYTATHHRIECRTRPYPHATEGLSYAPMKIAIITGSEYYISSLTFTYTWDYTIPVELVRPNSGPVGSSIEIASSRLPNPSYTYDRLYLGDLQCNHIDNETNRPYSIRWYWSKRHVRCMVENRVVGGYNASVQLRDWGNPRGRSWNGSEAMYLMYDGSLAMYELYPDVHSVSPHAGSMRGGTLLTVTGSGFGTNEWGIKVDVDGIPCQVMSHNATHIQCWTGRPHDDDLSIADEDGGYSVTGSGHRFRGSRGVSVKSYHGSISSLSSLRSQGIYPDNPSRHSTYPSFSSEDNYKRNNYGERLEAFFNPQTTGNHSFFVAADNQAEVMLGVGNNISDLTTVAHSNGAVGWQDFYRHHGDQRSDVKELVKDEDYLLVAEFAEGGGADFINVALLMHETAYTYSQTKQANRERQLLQISTTGHYEVQSLRVVVNASAISSHTDGDSAEDGTVWGLELEWDSDRRVVVPASDLLINPNDTVASALLSLFWGQCSYYTEYGIFHIEFWNDAVYGFEDSETRSSDIALWQAWNGDVPVVVRNEALCGRSSLYLPEGRGLVFDLEANSNLAIELEDVPYYMCFAYKLPRDHAFSLMFRLRGVGSWLSAYFIRDVFSFSATSMGSISNLYQDADIRDDNQWHYTCFDLQAIISNGFVLPENYEYTGVHYLEGFGFYADAWPQSPGFHLDEVSFSHNARNLNTTAYIPPSHPNGIIIENITATNDSVAMDNGLIAVTITLEFNPLDCGHNFTLFSARPTSSAHSVVHEAEVERVQRASQPLRGFFYLVVNGNGYSGETTPLSYDASTDEIKTALEAISGIGTITLTDGPFLSIDRYKTGCPGRYLNVQFDDLAGDQPMIHVESVWLTGDGVSVSVSEEMPGGMMSSPIPGHMLQTVEKTPQVHVRVKGQLAACSGDHALYHEFDPDLEEDTDFCRFSYSPPSTPHILTVAPPTATNGDTVTITGSGFGNNPSLVLVLFGDVLCAVTGASGEVVTCVLEVGVAGYKEVFLQVVGGNGGIAVANDAVSPLEYSVVLETVLPSEGSQEGGSVITIAGMGFAWTMADSDSLEWNPENEILSDAYQRAHVAGDNECSGGWENVVMVGEWECDIITSDHMTITCITPANQNAGPINTYDITVQVRCTDSDFTPLTATIDSGFTYSNDLTPEVIEVTPSQGSVHGGNSITITGNGFSNDPSEISVKLGDSTCTVTSATSTTIICTSSAHSGGPVPVTVMVSGNGFASGAVEYEFVFAVSSLSHCSGSLLGGQLLDITGEGFGMDPTQLEVLLGNYPCNVNEISDTLIRCVTSPTATTHIIDNNATSMEYGLGYVWNPDEITITVGDTVLWNWYGTLFTRQLSVQQVVAPGQTEYSGSGFISESGTRGSFSHVFTEAGDYYYIAGGYGHIGFNGTIHVVPLTDIEAPLIITISSVPTAISTSLTCGALSLTSLHYTFAVDQTPVVLDTLPHVFSYLSTNDVMVKGLATLSEYNLFTIGGKACLQSGMFSTNMVRPDYSGPANNAIVYSDEEVEVGCELDSVEPGIYWPELHVAGKGRGLVAASITVVPTYGSAHSDDRRGSLRGGTLLEISVRGFSRDDITKTRVDIGNTPCIVQNITPENERLNCLTQPARDDGYSSLVHALSPVAYWTLQTDHYGVDGSYSGSDGETVYRNSGEIGDVGDAGVRGDVVGREEGISGNAVTDQAVLFNNSYLEVPFHSQLVKPAGFGLGLWLKLPAVEEMNFENFMENLSDSQSELDPSSGQPGLGHFGSGQPSSGQPGLGSGQPLSGSGDVLSGSGVDDSIVPESVGPYQIVVDFASFVDGVARGYVIIINPCGQLEFWLASGQSMTTFSSNDVECPLISASDCSPSPPPLCSGLSLVDTDPSYLPPGVWSVIRCEDCDIVGKWGFVSVGWAPDAAGGVVSCEGSTLCSGQQVFHFNHIYVDTVATTYAAPANKSLLIGGTDRLPLGGEQGEEGVNDTLTLSSFVGRVDEVSVFCRPLTSQETNEHFVYGSTEKQKIWIRVEPIDGIGTGQDIDTVLERNGAFEEVEVVDWNEFSDWDIEIDEGKALLFSWTSLKGVWQVTKETYESCDVASEPVKEWSPSRPEGEVVVWMDRGETHYFIDSVAGNCLSGGRMKVKVGHVQVVTWTLDQTYEEITIPEGTGVLFKWSGPNYHNLIEMTSPDQSTSSQCSFVGSDADALGKVVRVWQATATTSGEVPVSGLSPGNHYFVCSVANHCERGMRINVTVTTDNQQEDTSDAKRSVDHVVLWKVQDYAPLTILHGDSITFSWEGFHSLHQVDEEAYETCDIANEPLLILADPSVDTTVPLTDLQPGTYYFICSVAGHCDAGMKISVVVLPSDNQPTLLNPVVALCHGPSGCSFVYSSSDTPTITGIVPAMGTVGTEVVVSGYGLVPDGYHDGLAVPTNAMTVWIGHAPCDNVTVVTTGFIETLQCTVTDYEAGYHFIDVKNARGLADVTASPPLTPGPHRNISEPPSENSPYPHFLLRPVVTSVSPDTGSTRGGAMVTIVGSGFSPVAERMQVLLGDGDCVIFSCTYSEIKCVTSEDGEGVRSVMVTVNGFVASTSATYEFSSSATPTISSVAPETSVGGNDIVISGTNFGTEPSTVSVHILNSIGEWQYGSMESSCAVSTVTDSSITCSLPVKPAGSYQVVAHVTGKGLAQTSSTIEYTLTLDSLSPSQSGNGGGVLVTVTGGGFPVLTSPGDVETESDDSLSVWFCSTECRVSSSSLSHVTCVLDTPSENDISSVCTSVRVSYNGMMATATQTFEFSDELTPHVTSVSPLIGGTAGGTIVTIHGSNLLPPGVMDPSEDDVIVTIDRAVCVWYNHSVVPTESTIECRTSDHKTTLLAEVKVFVRVRGFAIPDNSDIQIWYQYIDRWSSPYTWGNEGLPREGDSVLIKHGQIVFLDINTPVLNLILVEGELIFEDMQDLHLQAKYIFINTGKLQVGTEGSPFQHTARITLHGTVRDPEIPIYGAKVLGVRQGDLDLHGRRRERTWTRLAETARVNDTTISLTESVDWVEGDRIVVAATGKDGNETEENEIASVSSDGSTVMLREKLQFEHLGVTEVFVGGHFIEMRAEVGLLSHNVIVEGSRRGTRDVGGLGEDQYGVQIMIHRIGPYSTPVRIEHTEVRYAGQAFRLGRYAIHFHLTGSMIGSYVRNCAIHHSNNRALTAHGVHDLLIEGNVAYDIRGHTFFVEDGIETNNSYIRNLGILTRGSSSLLNTDQIPATFWITNPKNQFVGNAAVASRGFGFWYDLDNFPSGASYTTSVRPNREKFGQFRDNTAHTCNEFGLRIWESYTPVAPYNATLYNFTTYNNGIHGVEFSVIGSVIVDNFKIADNVENGFEIQEANVQWGEALIKNTLIVGHTSHNHGNPQLGGIKAINKGRFIISNVTFANFDLVGSACLRACSQCKVREGGFQVWLEGMEFLNSPNKVAFQWEHEVLFRDLDGSLTGHPGGGWVLPNSALLPPSFCSLSLPEFSVNPAMGGASCTSDVYFLRLAWNLVQPRDTLRGVSVNVTNEFGHSVVPWRHYRRTHRDGYMCTLPATYPHSIEWNLPTEHEVDVTSYSAGVYNVRPTDHVTITHRFLQLPDHVDISGNYQPTDSGDLPQYGVDPHLSWYINNDTNHTTNVTYLVSGESTGAPPYADLIYTYSYEPCPRDGCVIVSPSSGPREVRRWSDNSSWTNGQPPRAGDNVNINPNWLMIVDVSPPPLGQVFVHGLLQFEDGRDYNFTADLILIHGPDSGMIIGTAESPFQNRVTLTLTSNHGNGNLRLGSGLELGSKSIGVFGNVSMHGKPRDVTWTRLSSAAMAGTTVITVATRTGWLVGDQIVIAPSGWEVEDGEVRTITAIAGQDITIDVPLTYNHEIFNFLDPTDLNDPVNPQWWNDDGSIAPEVGLLSHNIVVQGGTNEQTDHHGCRLLVGRYKGGSTVYSGLLWLQSVEFRYCGHGGHFTPRDPRYSIAFRSSRETSIGSYVRDCAIHHGYNTAIGVHGSNGVTLSRNVVWRTVDSAVKIGGLGNEALDNLAIYTTAIHPNNPSDSVDFPACFDIDGGNVARGNAAAGSTCIGFRLAGEPCREDGQPPSSEQATLWGNTAHSGLIGLVILGLPSDCTAVSGFTATHQWNYGVFSSTASSLAVSHLRVSVGKVGVNLNVFGPDPVQHFVGGKSVSVSDSIIIGSLSGQLCSSSQPSWVPADSSIDVTRPSFGVMMSSFNKLRSKMDGTSEWHLMKGYPVIDGVLRLIDVTFARFTTSTGDCRYSTFAIGNNPLSPDAVHPVVMSSTTLLNCDSSSLVYFHDPNPDWINQEDCIDMDCDGPKHALIDDRDGTFVGSHPERGSVAPLAELRFSDYSHRLPESWLANAPSGLRATPSEVLEGRGEGVAKGLIPEDCEWMEDWNAYRCESLDHRMFVIESMDADSETRRLSPLALDGGNTGHGPYTDLLNGPMDHGWCTYYTCLKRLSTFFTIVATGTDYHIWMTGSNPSALRFHLLNAAPDEAIRLNIWYKNPQRKDVYKDGVYIEATNTVYLETSAIHEVGGEEYIPSLNSFSGANFFDRNTQFMHLILKGSTPVEIRTALVVQVAVDLAVSLDDFFDPNDLISRLAFVLRIDPSTIRVVKIVAEDSLPSRRRRQISSSGEPSSMTTITLEFGDPPDVNISQPLGPSVAQEVELAGEVNDSVDIEDASESTNQTLGGNPLNEDPPQSLSEYIASLNNSVTDYIQQVEEYLTLANETMAANVIGETVLNAILTNELDVENVTITGVTVIPASPPPPPSPPNVPPLPLFDNVTSEDGDNVTVELLTVLEGVLDILEETEVVAMESTPEPLVDVGEGVVYAIPDRMVVTMEPREETGHLVHVKLTIFDASGEPVKSLGLINPWMCVASLIVNERQSENERARLEGVTAVPFVNGVANFTRLRVDRKADQLTLSFTTVPKRFQTETTVQFSVVGLPETVERKQVSFLLFGTISEPVNWGSEEVIGEVVRQVGVALDIDISRIRNVTLQEIEWEGEKVVYVEFTLLGGHISDPPNVPSLQEAGETLQTLVDEGELTIDVDGVSLTALPESFDVTPSPPPTFTTGTGGGVSDSELVLIVAVGGASVAIVVSIVIMCVACCIKCRRGNRGKKRSKRVMSGRSSLSQLPRLLPTFKVNPIADDGGDSSDDSVEVVPSFRPPSRLPLPYTPNLPSSPDLWDYEQDDDTDSSSINNRNMDNSDCWTAPMYATPTYGVPPSRQGSKFSNQPTTLAILANPPPYDRSRNAPPSSLPHTSHSLTYIKPAELKGQGYRM